jgi:transposase-like protein
LINLPQTSSEDALTEILRQGAIKLLHQAVEMEIQEYVEKTNSSLNRVAVVRNGYLPKRSVQTGIGDIEVKQPRARAKDKRDNIVPFQSKILPPYLRRTKSIEELLPWLYLKGISTGDFNEALASILGEGASGLSASTITRLKDVWQDEYKEWKSRKLHSKHYVYIWADGIYFNVRLEDKRLCLLVVMGATVEGKKELIAVETGYRESTVSWESLLLSLRDSGLETAPEIAIGDGALGFWAALSKIYPETGHQRCWVHKTANVLDKLPKTQQPKAKGMIHEIYNSSSKAEAEKAFDRFVEVFSDKYRSSTDCLSKDRDVLLSFYDFPAEHWLHIRTTNPIESTFASVRLRTVKTKGCGSELATLTMVFKLAESASKSWKKLRGAKLLADVIDIRWKFVDGVKTSAIVA